MFVLRVLFNVKCKCSYHDHFKVLYHCVRLIEPNFWGVKTICKIQLGLKLVMLFCVSGHNFDLNSYYISILVVDVSKCH